MNNSWARLVNRCTYIPESRLEVVDTPVPYGMPRDLIGSTVRLHMLVQDTYNPGNPRKQEIVHSGNLPDLFMGDLDEDTGLRYLQRFIQNAAVHECDEWFRVDGKIYDDPHKRGR